MPDPALQGFLDSCPFAEKLTPEGRYLSSETVPVPPTLPVPVLAGRKLSTQNGFGDILAEIGRGQGAFKPLAEHIMTTSPDVTVSTNLGPWVNRRGIFDRHTRNDVFRDAKLASAQRWGMSPKGQHVELGIAEQNLFLLLGAAGLTHALTGARLLPIGTGITLAPEGGQHQSVNTPLIGMAADRLASFEPSHVDELAILLRHAFVHMQAPEGSAVWLRLSTRQLPQPDRTIDPEAVIAGGHWVVPPGQGARIALAYQGPVAPEVEAAFAEVASEEPGVGLLAITSPDRLHAGWIAAQRARRSGTPAAVSHVERLLAPLAPGAALVSVLDGHPASHSWLGAVRGHRVFPLGPDRFGQSGDIPDLYRVYGLDTDAILDACAQALLGTASLHGLSCDTR
jgi:pyruvate dehydrogenase E1 component